MDHEQFKSDMEEIFSDKLDDFFGNGTNPNSTGIHIKPGTGSIDYWADLYELGYFVNCVQHQGKTTQLWVWKIDEMEKISGFPDKLPFSREEPDIEQEAEDLLDEMSTNEGEHANAGGDDILDYECNSCGHCFVVHDVTEYDGCPECNSFDTSR